MSLVLVAPLALLALIIIPATSGPKTSTGLDLPPGRSQRSVTANRTVAPRTWWTNTVHHVRAASNKRDSQHLAMTGNGGISGAASSQGPGVFPFGKPQCLDPEGWLVRIGPRFRHRRNESRRCAKSLKPRLARSHESRFGLARKKAVPLIGVS